MKIYFPEDSKNTASNAVLAELFNGMKTREIVCFLNKKIGYSLSEISATIAVPYESVSNWARGKSKPNETTRFRIIEAFTDQKVKPPGKVLRTIKDTHHMHWEQERGWTVRFTITLNKKLVGKRRKIRLRTHDLKEALKRRDIAIDCYKNLGFEIANRIQRRVKK